MKLCILPTQSLCVSDAEFARLAASLPFGKSEYCRLISLKNKSVSAQSLAARLALFELCGGERFGEIVKDEFGKPRFSNEGAPFFSLSHTDGLAAAALDIANIGVDIELIRDHGFERIADRYFNADEKRYLEKANGSADAFFRIWTRKEASAKLDGRGLSAIVGKNEPFKANTKHFEINFRNSRAVLCVASQNEIGSVEILGGKEFEIYELQD